ncbi:MAG: hypothetical protein P8Y18_09210 [Candidatus Bathyarchaeota archaeon]
METKEVEKTKSKNPRRVDARQIYVHKNAQVTALTLQPGESLRRHITPVDVFFYVLEGNGIVEIGEEKRSEQRFGYS